MRMEAARTRRWAILSAPVLMGCAGLGMRAGGGAAGLIFFLMLSAVKSPIAYPYPRRRGLSPARLFFSWSVGAFTLAAWQTGITYLRGSPSDVLLFAMGILPACILCGRALTLPIGQKRAWFLGACLTLTAAFLLISGR